MLHINLPCDQVKRALIYWKSGKKNIPSGPPGFFSQTNWGDRFERRDGRDIPIKTTSNLVKIVKKLNTVQWTKILDAASALTKHRKSTASTTVINVEESSDSDFELEDGDEDLIEAEAPEDVSVTDTDTNTDTNTDVDME
jgi:hypothetical protein